MTTLALILSTLVALALTVLLAQLPGPKAQRRRDRPQRLLTDATLLYAVALFFPLWDYGLIDTLGLPLVRLWTPRPDITVGAAVLLVLPWFIAALRRGHVGLMGWQLPVRGGLAGLVILVTALLGALPLVQGTPVAPASGWTFALSFFTVALLDESLFRGAIQSRLEVVMAEAWPWLITGLLFGLWYAPAILADATATGATMTDMLLRLLFQLSLGWLLSVTRSVTGSLLPGLLAHFLFLQIGPLLALLLGR